MKLIWVNCFLPLDCCYLLATANVAALFLRWSVFPYVLTETAQFSTQLSVSKTKIAIREALHVSKHFHVNILTPAFVFYSVWKWDTANRRYRTLPYSYVFSFTYRAATLQINCTRLYALPAGTVGDSTALSARVVTTRQRWQRKTPELGRLPATNQTNSFRNMRCTLRALSVSKDPDGGVL